MNNSKAQASIEYLTSYAWAFFMTIMFVGVLFYFDIFNTQKYSAQYCSFDANFFCGDYTVQKRDMELFDARITLQNNMDKEILLEAIKLTDDDEQEILCDYVSIFCPLTNEESFGFAAPSNSEFIKDLDKSWGPTRMCGVFFENCSQTLPLDYKQKVNFNITFRGVEGSTIHTSKGMLYANVGELSEGIIGTGECDIASFDYNSNLLIQDNTGENLLMVDGNGMVLITGVLFEEENTGYDANDFKIEIGGTVVAWVSNPGGDLYLKGILEENTIEEPSVVVKEFIVQNSVDETAVFFDEDGNLFIKRCLKSVEVI